MITKSQAKRIGDINKLLERLGSVYEIYTVSQKTPMVVTIFIKVRDNELSDCDIKVASSANTRKELNQFLVGIETALKCVPEKKQMVIEIPENEGYESAPPWPFGTDDIPGRGPKIIFKVDTNDFSGIEPDEEDKL